MAIPKRSRSEQCRGVEADCTYSRELGPRASISIKSCEIGGGQRSDAGLPRRFDDIDAQSVDTIVGVGFSLHMTQECFAGTLGPDARPLTLGPDI
jgi:hypothetical protein